MKKNSDFVYIFCHIRKTGGSTLAEHLLGNYEPGERVPIQFPELYFNGIRNSHCDFLEKCRDYFSRYSKAELANIKVIHGHQVPYGIHKFIGRPARYVTIFRDPEKRAISFYNHFRTRYERETVLGKKHDQFTYQLLVDNKVPTFYEWVDKKYGHPKLWVNSTYQFLETLGYLKRTKNIRQDIDNMLKKFYFVAITEKSGEDFAFLMYLMGIRKFFVDTNVSIKFAKDSQVSKCRNLLNRKNKNDFLIYKRALQFNKDFKKNYSEFYKITESFRRKRNFFKNIDHLTSDPRNYLIEASAKLRSKSKIYWKVFDLFRGR